MRIFNIIPYWIDKNSGEIRSKKECLFLKMGNTYEEVYNWANINKKLFSFSFREVYDAKEITETNLQFDFSVEESNNYLISDINNIEYRVQLKPIAKIEIKKIETPLGD